MSDVILADPANMHLLGLMLKTLIARNLSDPKTAEKIGRLNHSVGVQAGKMQATVQFEYGKIHIEKGMRSDLSASVVGTLDAFLGFQLKPKIASLPAFATGALKVRGDLLKLLPILSLTRLSK